MFILKKYKHNISISNCPNAKKKRCFVRYTYILRIIRRNLRRGHWLNLIYNFFFFKYWKRRCRISKVGTVSHGTPSLYIFYPFFCIKSWGKKCLKTLELLSVSSKILPFFCFLVVGGGGGRGKWTWGDLWTIEPKFMNWIGKDKKVMQSYCNIKVRRILMHFT